MTAGFSVFLLTTEGTETRLRGARKDDGEEMNFVPIINISPTNHLPPTEGGRVVAGLCEADTFVGRFPCRPDGRFRTKFVNLVLDFSAGDRSFGIMHGQMI